MIHVQRGQAGEVVENAGGQTRQSIGADYQCGQTGQVVEYIRRKRRKVMTFKRQGFQRGQLVEEVAANTGHAREGGTI